MIFLFFFFSESLISSNIDTVEKLPPMGDTIHRSKSSPGKYIDNTHSSERPYFDDVSPRNVTAIVGQSAILHCRVKHLGQRTVRKKLLFCIIF